MIGKNITQPNDRLYPIEIKELYNAIVSPEDSLKSIIQQLRILQGIDAKKYHELKITLPYFICANFYPPYRNQNNFGNIKYFLVEIDYLSNKNLKSDQLKDKIIKLPETLLVFNSLGQNGVKIIFQLKDPCYDAAKFEIFYYQFTKKFLQQLNIDQVINSFQNNIMQTSFLSIDNHAYFNESAETVNMNCYVDFSNFILTEKYKIQIHEEKKQKLSHINIQKNHSLTSENILQIKDKLGIRIHKKEKQNHPMAETLPQKLEEIKRKLKEFDIICEQIINISFGKKLILKDDSGQKFFYYIFYKSDGYKIIKAIDDKNIINNEHHEIVYKILHQQLNCK